MSNEQESVNFFQEHKKTIIIGIIIIIFIIVAFYLVLTIPKNKKAPPMQTSNTIPLSDNTEQALSKKEGAKCQMLHAGDPSVFGVNGKCYKCAKSEVGTVDKQGNAVCMQFDVQPAVIDNGKFTCQPYTKKGKTSYLTGRFLPGQNYPFMCDTTDPMVRHSVPATLL